MRAGRALILLATLLMGLGLGTIPAYADGVSNTPRPGSAVTTPACLENSDSPHTTFTYDTRGNRKNQLPAVGSATCATVDQANRLTKIQTGTGSACATPTTTGTYAYDGMGLRESKTVSGTTTQFAWNSASVPLLIQQSAGSTITSFVYGPDGLPLEQISGSTTTWLHHDQLGSTRLLTDNTGASVATYTYDPYGNATASSGSATTPLMFSGEYRDTESGLIYLRARYYDPTTAQFLTRDPMVARTMSPYAYVQGNPLNATDPSGQWGFLDTVVGAAIGAVVGTVVGAVSYGVSVATGQQSWDTQQFFSSTIGGTVGGAVGGACLGTTWVAIAGCGALGGAAGAATSDLVSGRGLNAFDIVSGGVVGAGGGVVGAKLFPINSGWFKPQSVSNIWNPGRYAGKLFGQDIAAGAWGFAGTGLQPTDVC